MFIDIDYSKKKHKAKIQLAKPNKQIISNISEKYNSSLSLVLGNINELNFSIPHSITENFQLIRNPHTDLIKEKMLLKVTIGAQVEWFIVDSIEEDGDDTNVFNVTAYSLGFELSHKRIGIYESDSIGCSELIGDLLKDTSWTIGTIDTKFVHMKRFFSTSSSNSLDSLIEASETFGAIIFWDTVNRKVSFKDIKEIGKYKGLSVDYGKLLKSISRTRTTDEMTTRLYIYGNEDLSIQGVNATGQPYIEDFSYFIFPFKRDASRKVIESSNFMSDELCHAILDHREILNIESPNIKILVDNSLAKQTEILSEEVALVLLLGELETINIRLDVAKSTENQGLINTLNVELQQKQSEVNQKRTAINSLKEQYLDILLELETLRASVLMQSNFTSDLLDELSFFIIEKEWSDDRYIDADELYEDGLEKFIEIRQPKVVITIDIENLFEIMEEQINWSRLVLGDLIKVRYPQMNIEYLARIIQIDHDIEDGNIQVTIANTSKTGDELEQLKAILSNSQSASTLIQNNLHKWNKIHLIEGEVTKLINDEWDANKRQITAGVNNQIEIGKRGIIIRNPDLPNEIVIIQSGIIALSKDNGDSWKTAIKPDGIIAERLIGKVILGTRLIIEDEKGIMRFTGSLQEIFNNDGVAKVEIGEYETGVYGMRIDNGSIEIVNGLPKSQIDPIAVEIWDTAEGRANAYADTLKIAIDGEIADLHEAIDSFSSEIDSTFRDGVISEAEAISIAIYINIINTEKSDLDSRYNVVYNDIELAGTPKTNLLIAKTSYNTNHTNLINSINTAIADSATTPAEKTNVDTQFNLYRASITTLSQCFEEAIDATAQVKATKALTDANAFTQAKIDLVNQEIADVDGRITVLNTYVDGAFEDGVIEQVEAIAIQTYINSLNTEKADVDSKYNNVYNNASVLGTYKTNLSTAKTAFDTAHTNLISSINTAITDSKTTPIEKADVNSKFATYRPTLATLSTRLEEAIRSMDTSSVIRTDLRLTAPLPTSISLNANGITATTTGDVNKFARLDYRGLYVQGGAIDIRTNAITNRGVVLDGNGLRGYDNNGVITFEINPSGIANYYGTLNANQITVGKLKANQIETSELIVGTNIAMGANAVINWSQIGSKPYIPTSASDLGAMPTSTYIDANGVFTGMVRADKIQAGTISSINIISGNITSNTNINVTTNVNVGNNIYFSYDYNKRFEEKGIIMYDGNLSGSSMFDCRIVGTYLKMDIISRLIRLNGKELIDIESSNTRFFDLATFLGRVDLSNATTINWGSNAPTARFG